MASTTTANLDFLSEAQRQEYERVRVMYPHFDADDVRKALLDDVLFPPGALGFLRNRMRNVWYELTDNPDDPLLNQPERTFLPNSREEMRAAQQTPTAKGAHNILNALAFSHLTSRRDEFEAVDCMFEPVKGLHTLMDGIMFDKRTVDAMKGYDWHVHSDESGNILAIFLVPPGWTEAYNHNQVCHRCGNFPAYLRCFDCNSGAFCTDECLLRSLKSEVHSPLVCEEFIRKKVDAANPILVADGKKKEKEENKVDE